MILAKIKQLRPGVILDVGCGCGSYSKSIAEYCQVLVAIEPSTAILERALNENPHPAINYVQMDGQWLGFRDSVFDLVYERYSLHHMRNPRKSIREMIRVARDSLLFEEPVDEIRYPEKKHIVEAQRFYLELQREAGITHFTHFTISELEEMLRNEQITYQFEWKKVDETVSFDEYFEDFPRFAQKTQRYDYWIQQLEVMKRYFDQRPLILSDSVLFTIQN